MARLGIGKLKPSALLATVVVLGLYYVLLKTSLAPGTLRQTRQFKPKRRSVQSCVHDPIPCPRLRYAHGRPENGNDAAATCNSTWLIDLRDFAYLLDAPPCSVAPGREATLLVLVHSAAAHFAERDVIRTTWGAGWPRSNVTTRVVFMLARTPGDPALEERMERENRRYGDTVQGNFVDSYRNLTYKHVMALRWASTRCGSVAMVLKMDDDIFVHVFQLAAILDKVASAASLKPKVLFCYVQKQMPISRSVGSKWKVTESEYPGSFFEDYCSGWAYLADMAAVRAMATEAQYRPYFWVDDVHVTGTLARMGGVSRSRINHKYTTEADSLALWAKPGDPRDSGLLDWGYAFGPTWGDVALVARAHRKALWCRRRACKCCFKAVSANAGAATNGSSAKNGVIGKAVVKPLSGV
ncbi:acetylgalactosaminyl-O-glycosyl-glycoprotein beta-1,3-N-acetylglucosaminyltransferase-like [Dermacentor variabilis]|uniref:acetylgalactosaminyl-O-glycosyl-glycoprotein beta-1,3-N-acetylglucosaminyltransferase-like n=1 Tax=Dermacentor variabilis TaxID=34621 RepID=UPI003F5CB5F0